MKRTMTMLLLLTVSSLCFGWVSVELEMNKDSLPTIPEMEYLKTLLPKEKDYINESIVAALKGADSEYSAEFSVFTDTPASQILRVELEVPGGTIYTFDYDGSFEYGDTIYEYWFEKTYFAFNEMKTRFPFGDYTVRVVYKNGNTDEDILKLPDYNASDFLNMVQGELTWDNGILKLDWSTVDGSDYNEYEVCAAYLLKDDEAWEKDVIANHPSQVTTYFVEDDDNITLRPGMDYSVEVEASYYFASNIWFDSETEWFIFKKPMPAIKQNTASKSTVTAGKSQGMGSISFSGTLDAIEADFLLGMGNNVEVSIYSDLMTGPISFLFPINDTTLKKGKYKSSASSKGSTYAFSFDAKTGKMSFSAKNVNLTGLECPIYVTVIIGNDYKANLELTETVVNGTKLCPPQLMMGAKNSLTVSKSSFKQGKTAGTDSFTVQGTFTIDGSYDKSNPLVITLGTQTFSVIGSQFPDGKAGIESCKKAVSTGGAIIDAKLDFVKCTYTITVKNAAISNGDDIAFGINCFGVSLEGFASVDIQ